MLLIETDSGEPSLDKSSSRNVGIAKFPVSDNPVYQDLAAAVASRRNFLVKLARQVGW
jgi:hypothetical protein